MRIVTISYHDVVRGQDYDSSGFAGEGPATYKLTQEQFRDHMEALASARCSGPVLVTEADPSRRPLCLAFDDGGAGAMIAAEVLERHGWRGHFFLTTDRIGQATFVRQQDVIDLAHRGHLVGSHSCSHPDPMSGRTDPELLREWVQSREKLEDILGGAVTTGSIPGGFYSKAVAMAAARAGYTHLFTSEPRERCWKVGSCTVLGRYTVRNGMPASTLVRLAEGTGGERFRQSVQWNVKKIAKTLGGDLYFKARRRFLKNRA